jgi:hypothetical protein
MVEPNFLDAILDNVSDAALPCRPPTTGDDRNKEGEMGWRGSMRRRLPRSVALPSGEPASVGPVLARRALCAALVLAATTLTTGFLIGMFASWS